MTNEIFWDVTILAGAIAISLVLDVLGKSILRSAIKKANHKD